MPVRGYVGSAADGREERDAADRFVDRERVLQRWTCALLAIHPVAQPARRPDRHDRLVAGEIETVRVDHLASVRDVASDRDGILRLRRGYPPLSLRTVRATWKKIFPSGICDSCVRIIPGVRNASKTFHRGQAPLKRANRRPDALNRFEMLPAMSMRIIDPRDGAGEAVRAAASRAYRPFPLEHTARRRPALARRFPDSVAMSR